MRAFLFLEHKFYKNKNKIYAEKSIDYRYMERYIQVFDEICICAREVKEYSNTFMEPLILDKRISFFSLPNVNSKELVFNYSKIKKEILKEITKEDVAIFRAPSSISFVLYHAIKNLQIPIAVELVADADVFFVEEKGELYLSRMLKKIERYVLVKHAKTLCYKANAVLYVTKYYLQKKYPSYSLSNGESVEHFDVACSDVILYDNYYSKSISTRTKENELVICHMGAMEGNNKGQKTVIDIVKDINEKGCKCKAILIGNGTFMEGFKAYAREKRVEEQVVFTGQLNEFSSIKKIFSESHIFVFPSENEGLPRSILEAMANSLPCIAYDVGGISELIDCNLLVKKDNYDELLDKVWSIANAEVWRKDIAESNYLKSREYRDCILSKKRHLFYQQFRDMAEQRIRGDKL